MTSEYFIIADALNAENVVTSQPEPIKSFTGKQFYTLVEFIKFSKFLQSRNR